VGGWGRREGGGEGEGEGALAAGGDAAGVIGTEAEEGKWLQGVEETEQAAEEGAGALGEVALMQALVDAARHNRCASSRTLQ